MEGTRKMVLLCIISGTFLLGLGEYLTEKKMEALAGLVAMAGIVVAVGGICIFS